MLNLRDPLIVPQDHLGSLDDAPHKDGRNGAAPFELLGDVQFGNFNSRSIA